MGRKRILTANDTDPTLLFFEPRNESQRKAIEIYQQNDITFFLGPAGVGKTQIAIYCALMDLYGSKHNRKNRIDKLIITRPIVEAGEHLGSLPGTVGDKVEVFFSPIYTCISKIVGNSSKLIKDHVVISPLAYMRGITLERCTALLDEAQNCDIGQIKLFLSRLGVDGKIIISGDMDQSDIKRSGLAPWVSALRGVPGIGFMDFTDKDIVRHSLVRTILARAPK